MHVLVLKLKLWTVAEPAFQRKITTGRIRKTAGRCGKNDIPVDKDASEKIRI